MTGILLVDKEQGWTSSDVVARLRGILHERRIGHAGTLDPLATGLLVVMVGRAARASDYLMRHPKQYRAVLRPGIVTDTQDITGRILSRSDAGPSEQELEAVLAQFRGEQTQIPPMYSAIKVKGRKLYDIARRGERLSVHRAPSRWISLQSSAGKGTISSSISRALPERTSAHSATISDRLSGAEPVWRSSGALLRGVIPFRTPPP